MNWRFQFDTDCSDTFALRAASATDISPARIDNTSRDFSSGGNALGRAIRNLQDQIKLRPEPDFLKRDNLLVVRSDGSVDAVGSGIASRDGMLHATLDGESVARLQRCVDDSDFLALPEGSHSPAYARAGDKFCAVSDAATTTIVLRSTTGDVRTASADGLGLEGDSCPLDRPPSLTIMFRALDDLRERVAEVGTP
jgi:hypothetical protein